MIYASHSVLMLFRMLKLLDNLYVNDGVHLKEEGTYILASTFVDFLNDYVLYIRN